jgi:hypothetical protein
MGRSPVKSPSGAVAAVLLWGSIALAAEPAKKPPVPPGVDPGGVLIALIGEGIDYTMPAIAARLARDGEGELIGWDFADNDRRPYQRTVLHNGKPIPGVTTGVAQAILDEASAARIAAFRLKDPYAIDRRAIAIALAANARIVVLHSLETIKGGTTALSLVSETFPNALIVAAGPTPSDAVTVLTVGNSTTGCDGRLDAQQSLVDVAAPGACFAVKFLLNARADGATQAGTVAIDETAAARIAALAARMIAAEPKLTGAELKARIVALAKRLPEGAGKIATHGDIEDPAAHYRAK